MPLTASTFEDQVRLICPEAVFCHEVFRGERVRTALLAGTGSVKNRRDGVSGHRADDTTMDGKIFSGEAAVAEALAHVLRTR